MKMFGTVIIGQLEGIIYLHIHNTRLSESPESFDFST